MTEILNINAKDFYQVARDLLQGSPKATSIRFRASGSSMSPLVKDGDVIEVNPVKPTQIRRGDIILYYHDSKLICHRVIKINAGKFALKADYGEGVEWVENSHIVGKVISRTRRGRRLCLDNTFYRLLGYAFAMIPAFAQQLIYRAWRAIKKAITMLLEPPLLRYIYIYSHKVIAIKQAALSDAEALYEYNKMGTNSLSEFIPCLREELKTGARFVAVVQNKVIGSVTISRHDDKACPPVAEATSGRREWGIYGLGVKILYRNRGVGERLLREALEYARSNRASLIRLAVPRNARPAIRLYHRFGFCIVNASKNGFMMSK